MERFGEMGRVGVERVVGGVVGREEGVELKKVRELRIRSLRGDGEGSGEERGWVVDLIREVEGKGVGWMEFGEGMGVEIGVGEEWMERFRVSEDVVWVLVKSGVLGRGRSRC